MMEIPSGSSKYIQVIFTVCTKPDTKVSGFVVFITYTIWRALTLTHPMSLLMLAHPLTQLYLH